MATKRRKPGIEISIPGSGSLHIRAVCSDYTGTLSCEGELIAGVEERLAKLAGRVDIHIVTSDTRKTAAAQLETLKKQELVTLVDTIPSDVRHDVFKLRYMRELGIKLRDVAVFGNGRNDVKWLKAVKHAGGLAVAVDVGEGCAMDAMNNPTVFVGGIVNALDLLLDTKRVIGTLRTEGDT